MTLGVQWWGPAPPVGLPAPSTNICCKPLTAHAPVGPVPWVVNPFFASQPGSDNRRRRFFADVEPCCLIAGAETLVPAARAPARDFGRVGSEACFLCCLFATSRAKLQVAVSRGHCERTSGTPQPNEGGRRSASRLASVGRL